MLSYLDFQKYYKNVSNAELLSILQYPDQYQPDALRAAKEEFDSRNLSEQEVAAAEEANTESIPDNTYLEKAQVIGAKITASGTIFFQTLNPIQKEIPTPERIVRFIAAFMLLYYIVDVFEEFSYLTSTIRYFNDDVLVSLITLLPFLYLPVAIFTFWRHRNIGWRLLLGYLIFNLICIGWVTMDWILHPMPEDLFYYYEPPIGLNVIQLVMHIVFIFVLCGRSIRVIFKATPEHTLIVGILASSIAFFCLYLLWNA